MRRLTILAAALSMLWAASASAERVAIAPLERLGVSKRAQKRVANWLEDEIQALKGASLVPAKKIARRLRVAGVIDCSENPKCFGKQLRSVRADVGISGNVGAVSDSYVVSLRLVSRGGKLLRNANGVVNPKGARAAIRALVYRLLRPKLFVGTVKVNSDVPDATVYLDGRKQGKGAKLVLTKIPVGTHAIRVTHPAYRDLVRFLEVKFGKTYTVKASLRAFPIAKRSMKLAQEDDTYKDSELPWYRRWWAVTIFGAVLFAGSATAVALIPRSVSRDRTIRLGP